MRLKAKTTVTILIPILLTFIAMVGYSSYKFYVEEKRVAVETAELISQNYSYQIEAEMEVAMDAARVISDVAEGLVENGDTRITLDTVLKKVLVNNERE